MTILYLVVIFGVLQVTIWAIGLILTVWNNLQKTSTQRQIDERIQSLVNRYYQEKAADDLRAIIYNQSTTETSNDSYPYGNPPTFGRR